jgi:hypothetical protein
VKAQQLWWRLAAVVILVGILSVMQYQISGLADVEEELLELRSQVWKLEDRVDALPVAKVPAEEAQSAATTTQPTVQP